MYALLRKNKEGVIEGLNDASFSMKWIPNSACLWKTPPTHYFNPKNGNEFMVKTTRHYKDIYFTGEYSGIRRNKEFLPK